MHTYSIDKNIRGKALLIIYIISVLASSVLTSFFSSSISIIFSWFNKINCISILIDQCDKMGVTPNLIGTPFLYGLLYWIYDEYLWKTPLFLKLHNVPNLNGVWKGTLVSSFNKTAIEIEMDVKQTWNKISFISKFPNTNSKSESNNATIYIESNGSMKIGFGFISRSRELSMHQFDGYNILEFDDINKIFGRYFNNRDNTSVDKNNKGGNKGSFNLTKCECG